MRDRGRAGALCAALLAVAAGMHGAEAAQTWRGLTVAPEHRCTLYERGDYPYPQSVEACIVASMGERVYGPYTGRHFASRSETDISHIVAFSEAHDSGLCAADEGTRRRFASDLLNLTLAGPEVNRHDKWAHDAGEWLPPMNRCWFAARVVAVKSKYRLTVDAREARALEGVLSRCASTAMVVLDGREAAPSPKAPAADRAGALQRWDTNGNGRIACREAREHGIAPVRRDHPAYPFMRDRDGDGVVCE